MNQREREEMHQEKRTRGFKMQDEKILLVDDEDNNLKLLTQWLIPLGYDIEFASNGEEAVQKARSRSSRVGPH